MRRVMMNDGGCFLWSLTPPELEQATKLTRCDLTEYPEIQPAVAIDTKSVRYRPMKYCK